MQALCLPLGASVSLLIMFFFFDSMQMLFAICTAGTCGHWPPFRKLRLVLLRSKYWNQAFTNA